MQWYNEPPSWTHDSKENLITVTTGYNSDFWRITHYGFIRDTGHFYYEPVEGDFTLDVKVIGAYKDLYDQAGIMVRQNETNWIKCGIELVEGVQQASVVVTREFSDWSVVALHANPEALWLRVKRYTDTVEVYYSLNGTDYTMLRLAYFPPGIPAQVGVMCASPQGQGFTVRFEDFTLRTP